eukprot:TCONS_00044978-protein
MKLNALAVYLPDRYAVESVLDAAIDCGVGKDVVAVTRSLKRTYVHLESLEAKQHLLKRGFLDPVEAKPLVVTAQGIPIELTKDDVIAIFSTYGKVLKVNATMKKYRDISYRNGNWQIHFKQFYEQLPNHISTKNSALCENIYITTVFDNAEMLKRVVPTRSSESNPPPLSQPQSKGEIKTKIVYQIKTTSTSQEGVPPMEVDKPTKSTSTIQQKKVPVGGNRVQSPMEVDKPNDHSKRPKVQTTPMKTNSNQGSVAQSAAKQTSNPEVPVQTPSKSKSKTKTKTTSTGELRTPITTVEGDSNGLIPMYKPTSMKNNFSSYYNDRNQHYNGKPTPSMDDWDRTILTPQIYGHVAWSHYLNKTEWASLMHILSTVREQHGIQNSEANISHFAKEMEDFLEYSDSNESGEFEQLGKITQIEHFLTIARNRCKSGIPRNCMENWGIWRFNDDLFFK